MVVTAPQGGSRWGCPQPPTRRKPAAEAFYALCSATPDPPPDPPPPPLREPWARRTGHQPRRRWARSHTAATSVFLPPTRIAHRRCTRARPPIHTTPRHPVTSRTRLITSHPHPHAILLIALAGSRCPCRHAGRRPTLGARRNSSPPIGSCSLRSCSLRSCSLRPAKFPRHEMSHRGPAASLVCRNHTTQACDCSPQVRHPCASQASS